MQRKNWREAFINSKNMGQRRFSNSPDLSVSVIIRRVS
jgi:hypothetical protein